MLDHVGVFVSDYTKSKQMYGEALKELKYGVKRDMPEYNAVGFGLLDDPSNNEFWIGQGESDIVQLKLADTQGKSFKTLTLCSCQQVRSLVATCISHSLLRAHRWSMPGIRQLWQQVSRTTGRPASDRSTTQATTGHLYLTQMAIILRQFSMQPERCNRSHS